MHMNLYHKPTIDDFENIKKGEFYITNGQHRIEASKTFVKDKL